MQVGKRRFGSVPLGAISAVILFAMLVVGTWTRSAGAQDGTPAASPAASPVAGQSCGEVLGIGDASVACVNVVHASFDAPNVDVLVDGTAALSSLAFGTSSSFVPLPAGTYDVRVTAAGDPTTVALDLPGTTLEAGVAYEVAAIGSLAAGTITAAVNTVDLSPLPGETARIRVVHGVTDGPAVDIAAGGQVIVAGLAAGTTSDYVEAPAGTPVDVEIRAAGDPNPLLPIPVDALVPGTAVTIYAAGSVADVGNIMVISVQATVAGGIIGGTPAASPVASPAA